MSSAEVIRNHVILIVHDHVDVYRGRYSVHARREPTDVIITSQDRTQAGICSVGRKRGRWWSTGQTVRQAVSP